MADKNKSQHSGKKAGTGRASVSPMPGLFQPGQSGNPNGRPKRNHALSEQLRAMMASKEIQVEVTIKNMDGKKEIKKWELKSSHDFNTIVAMALIEKAVKGDVFAFNTIADRLEGKPVQTNLNLEDSDEFKNLSIEEKQEKLTQLLARTIGRS